MRSGPKPGIEARERQAPVLPIAALLFGFVLGWTRAARRGGTMADRWQFAVGHALAFGLGGFLAAILIVRSGLFG